MVKKNNIFDNSSKIIEWLCSTGYLFPSTEVELARFNKLYPDSELIDSTVCIERIINNQARTFPIINHFNVDVEEGIIDQFRMVARKGLEDLPDNVIKKMLGNQDKDENSSEEED